MLWIWESWAALLLVLVPVGGTLRWVLDVLLYVVLQGVTVFCRVFPFRVKRASGVHYFLEVLGAGSSGWSAAATRSSPLRLRSLGLEDSAESFFGFWRG